LRNAKGVHENEQLKGKQDGEEPPYRVCRGVPGKEPLHLLRQQGEERGLRSDRGHFRRDRQSREREHAKRLFKFLEGGDVEVTAAFPAGVVGSTAENLKAAAGGEHYEWESMYPEFANVAREEGFGEIAEVFESVAVAEKQHEKRYLDLLANVEAGTVFKKKEKVVWRCRNCGYLHEGTEAPDSCPACAHPQAHFELLAENW